MKGKLKTITNLYPLPVNDMSTDVSSPTMANTVAKLRAQVPAAWYKALHDVDEYTRVQPFTNALIITTWLDAAQVTTLELAECSQPQLIFMHVDYNKPMWVNVTLFMSSMVDQYMTTQFTYQPPVSHWTWHVPSTIQLDDRQTQLVTAVVDQRLQSMLPTVAKLQRILACVTPEARAFADVNMQNNIN